MKPPGRGLVIYAVFLFALMILVAFLAPSPFSWIALMVAAVAALFLVLGVIVPGIRS